MRLDNLAVRWICCFAMAAVFAAHAAGARADAAANSGAVIVVDFVNPGVSPSHWTLTLHPDGSAHFSSERGDPPAGERSEIDVPNVDRDAKLDPRFAAQVFSTAERHHRFDEKCESGLKVAFQGWKQFSYAGPDGKGSCRFNYSQDKEIQALGDTLLAVAETMREGAKLELLLQHDRLGLDRETEYLADAAKDGRVKQLGAIRDILTRLAADDTVLERVRRRAKSLLAEAGE